MRVSKTNKKHLISFIRLMFIMFILINRITNRLRINVNPKIK